MDAQAKAWQQAVRGELADPAVPFSAHWQRFQAIFADRSPEAGPAPVWVPDAARIKHANMAWLKDHIGVPDVDALITWSSSARDAFWSQTLERLQIPFATMPDRMRSGGATDPVWLPGAAMNISAACWNAAGDQVAIISGKEGSHQLTRITYAELKRQVDEVSHGLVRLGLATGDAVALYMPMNVECVVAYLAIVQAGMVVVSIPDSFAPAEVATRLRLGAAKAIITVDAFQRGGKAVPMAPKAREAAGAGVRVVVIGEAVEGDAAWSELLGNDEAFTAVPCDPYATTNILFSSGTTGEPKAIPWTHLTPLKAAADGHYHQDIHPGDVVAWPTNIGWMMGPWLIYASLVNRGTMALYEGIPTSQGFIDFVRTAKVAMLGVVPAIVRAWRDGGNVQPHDLPDVQVFSSTGEASNLHDYLYLMSLAGYRAPVIEYCGGTEIGGGHITGTVLKPASPATFSCPALGLDFVILDEAGAAVAPGGHGQIFLVPPSIGLSQRLLNREHDAEYYEGVPTGPNGEPLRRHGDEVHVLHGGYWAAGGRADDTMNLGGIKVSSVELEAAMNRHTGVSETAAVAVTPEGGGAERLVVFVVAPGGDSRTLKQELQARIKADLNPLFRIHDVVLVDALPRTASNKVMRRELRKQYTYAGTA